MDIFKNQTVLITGGTGTFGQEVTKYILKNHNVKKLIVFSRDENKQFLMSKTIGNNKRLRFFLGDVRDVGRLLTAFRGVDYIIHSAAMKHVAAAEYNPLECIKTNVNGTENIIHAAIERKVKKVVGLSTDKACNPSNLYGATKLCSEKLFVNANQYSNFTKFFVVRYGNVVGSRGSAIPFFLNLANNKKSIPLTSKEMTRFFISVKDAIEFVLSCMKISSGGEIFIPKMNSIKIIDLIKLINFNSKINIIGVRPGEKLHESLYSVDESRNIYIKDKYFILYSDNLSFKKKIGVRNKDYRGYISNDVRFNNIKKIKSYLSEFVNELH